jgi:hypothetical protein
MRTSRLRLFGAEAPLSLWLTVEPVVTAYVYVQQGQGQCFWAYIKTFSWLLSLFLFACSEMTFLMISITFLQLFLWVAPKWPRLFDLSLFALSSLFMGRSQKWYPFLFSRLSPRPIYIYIQIFWGSPKTPALAFSGRRPWRRWLASVLACVFLG